jgi:hypothetical protein
MRSCALNRRNPERIACGNLQRLPSILYRQLAEKAAAKKKTGKTGKQVKKTESKESKKSTKK